MTLFELFNRRFKTVILLYEVHRNTTVIKLQTESIFSIQQHVLHQLLSPILAIWWVLNSFIFLPLDTPMAPPLIY